MRIGCFEYSVWCLLLFGWVFPSGFYFSLRFCGFSMRFEARKLGLSFVDVLLRGLSYLLLGLLFFFFFFFFVFVRCCVLYASWFCFWVEVCSDS